MAQVPTGWNIGSERENCFDRQIGEATLTARRRSAFRLPSINRVLRQPNPDIAATDEATIVMDQMVANVKHSTDG